MGAMGGKEHERDGEQRTRLHAQRGERAMASYLIQHAPRLSGEVEVSTAKNAVLPILAAGLLTEDPLIVKTCRALPMWKRFCKFCAAAARRSSAAARM